MTRKHFAAVAAVLAAELAVSSSTLERNRMRGVTLSLADVFAQSNDRFDRARFYVAAGLTAAGYLTDGGK